MTPQELKNSILQFAIQGKLVEQQPQEGTGAELYEHIQAEKKALLKEGKIKKEKPLPEITDDEKPFDIPESWIWVRIGKIVNHLFAGGDKPADFTEVADERRTIPVIANGITNDGILGYTATATAKANTITVAGRGTIGFSLFRDYEYCPVVRLIIIEHNSHVFPQYLQRVIEALPEKSLGTSIPQLTVPMLYPKLIPLPPLTEQMRIVAKIEELMPLIGRYEQAWTKLEDFNKRFPGDMQKSILQMAIQGKLVPQDDSEGTGEELYCQIQAEKQKLIKDGKIKKEKPLPEIAEDEIPFEIPENWIWVRLNSVISLLSGSDLTPDKYNDREKGVPYITGASNIEGGRIFINRWTEFPNNIAHYGDLLLTCKGTVGKTAILTEREVHIARQIMAISPVLVDAVFVQRFIESQVKNLKSKAKSMIPGIERDNVLKLAFPLPPLAEQERIVAKLEELLPLCDRLK